MAGWRQGGLGLFLGEAARGMGCETGDALAGLWVARCSIPLQRRSKRMVDTGRTDRDGAGIMKIELQ